MTSSKSLASNPALDRDTLNLGCGAKKLASALNVDSQEHIKPDLVVDLDSRPWPLPTDHFRDVHAYDVIEHLEDVIGTLEEIHRVCRPGAIVRITVPHFSSANAFTDPTHKHYFGYQSFHYLTDEHEHGHYSKVRFRRRVTKIVFHQTMANKIVRRLANARPVGYERRWAWTFPAWFLYVELEVLK
jgi:SAM-dependent methyltransferase